MNKQIIFPDLDVSYNVIKSYRKIRQKKKKKKKLRVPNPLENRFYPGLRRNLGLSEKYFHKPLLFRWKLS